LKGRHLYKGSANKAVEHYAAKRGEVSAYRIERRKLPAGLWEMVGTGPLSEITLVDQTRNVEWEYRVIAFNKAGDFEP